MTDFCLKNQVLFHFSSFKIFMIFSVFLSTVSILSVNFNLVGPAIFRKRLLCRSLNSFAGSTGASESKVIMASDSPASIFLDERAAFLSQRTEYVCNLFLNSDNFLALLGSS